MRYCILPSAVWCGAVHTFSHAVHTFSHTLLSVLLQKHKSVSKNSFQLEMDNNSIGLSPTTTLGILRAETRENIINIEERLSLAHRTLYALINTGVHGSNGLNPKVSLKIYQCYVIPRMLFGLEVLPLNKGQLNTLAKFHLDS